MPQEFARLTERLLAGRAFKETLHPMDLLVVEQVGRLKEALIAEVAFERAISRVFVSAAVANKSVLLFETHLTLLALKRSLL